MIVWEALYSDGSSLREAAGGQYAQIDRSRLHVFRLVGIDHREVFGVTCTPEQPGENFCYRRRGIIIDGAAKEYYIMGWAPMGPAYAYSEKTGRALSAPRFSNRHPILFPPTPNPSLGEFRLEFS